LAADREEVVVLAKLPVLGQRAARLAHEPDRSPFDGFEPAGACEERLGHVLTLAAWGPTIRR